MKKKKIINSFIALLLIIAFYFSTVEQNTDRNIKASDMSDLYNNNTSDEWVEFKGIVIRLLHDDNEGSRHQRFIVKVKEQSILIAHNIDIAEKINTLSLGDKVEIRGEYEWNEQGGVVHWTHDDAMQKVKGGWIKHKGKLYK